MCYVLLLSTTSSEDLAVHNNERVRFSKDLPQIAGAASIACTLMYQNRWYIGSQPGCSCSFRHLHSVELGFGEPEDWYREEPDYIKATLQLVKIVRALVASGHGVDCIDFWQNQEMAPLAVRSLDVDLASLRDSQFRFFENHHFSFRSAT